jgi:transforming growth factor-beta-induced protein
MRIANRIAVTLALGTLAGAAHAAPAGVGGPAPTITEIAQSSSDFRFLVEALRRTNLLDTFDQPGDFTVLAPTNGAFAALGQETIRDLFWFNQDDLAYVLSYHVIVGSFSIDELGQQGFVTTLSGQRLRVRPLPLGRVEINGVEVLVKDVPASNGTVQVIDGVLLPNLDDIVETAQSTSIFSTLVDAVVAADLVDFLQGDGPFTVFAPTNAAFGNLPPNVLADLLLPQNQADLIEVLSYHVVDLGRVYSGQAAAAGTAPTALPGASLTFTVSPQGQLTVNGDVPVLTANLDARNGVIHVIGEVLIPPGF